MMNVNFLPWREELKEKQKNQFAVLIILFLSVGAGFIGGWGFLLSQTLSNYSTRASLLKKSLDEAKSDIEKIDELKKERQLLLERMQIVQNLQSARSIPVRTLQDIADLKPNGIFLTSINTQDSSYTEKSSKGGSRNGIIIEKIETKIILRGKSNSRNAVAQYNVDLNNNSCWFKNAAWTFINDSGSKQSFITDSVLDFEIIADQSLVCKEDDNK